MLQLLHIHSGVRFIDCKPPAAFGDAARTWCVRSCRPRGVGGQQSQSFSTRYIGPTRAFSIKTGKESNWTLRQTDPEGLQPVTKFSKLKGGYGPLKIFSGNAHPELAKQLADRLGVSVAGATVNNFANGETQVLINNSVRECDVYVVQPTCNPKPNQYLMELLIMLDACRRGGARRTTAVMPIFGYARQDKKDRSRGPIAAKLVANMLHVAGADRVVTVDLHSSQIQGFADFSIDNLYALPLLAAYIKEAIVVNGTDCVVVSPDAGGAKRADIVAKELQCDIAIFSKTRKAANTVDSMTLVGDVQGKAAILVDDMCDTGGTLVMAARKLRDAGAASVHAAVVHGVFSDPAMQRIADSPIEQMIFTDTIPLDPKHLENNPAASKLVVLPIAPLLAEAIRNLHNGASLSQLFDAQSWHASEKDEGE